ncbi:MAG TPA: precorrin-6y C5,15-methyltransferase (decarboxylating) subunit CbiE [Oligoflexus sp.]|uniref:precorrin-6y C5,15-methyltransferase (decarboxylating) subunit CbiE n=1 Tax=Oligoflexus sp. TaxID=1971216 RepID=UPI002D3C2E94|nr:precorrin-6y C5,15-methyltransferase (decarboxylating) subunit CbiE [Oligoflexus sp.]HYX35492.1 precorrin-6y C5,15-methyltransferase (decarboxylating) subunit CbiE [Oligoflexus sp.]
MRQPAVIVIGIGEDGCLGLSSRAYNCIRQSQILVGGQRQLDFFNDYPGRRVVLAKKVKDTLEGLRDESGDHNIVILASGDPLFYGVGSLAVKIFGAEFCGFIPQPSSMQLAFAAAGLSWSDATCLSVHGRSIEGLCQKMRRLSKVALLTDQENSPVRVALHFKEYHDAQWDAVLCENLGGTEERVRRLNLEELSQLTDVSPLNVLILTRHANWRCPPAFASEPEEAYARRIPKLGLITKREIRVLSLAALQLPSHAVVWDIGAGSGSVSIEASRIANEGRVLAIECEEESQGFCAENILKHGADNVRLIAGEAPAALEGLDSPDAVFIGGSKGKLDALIQFVWQRLNPGGRLVINAVTMENVSQTVNTLNGMGLTYDVNLVQIARSSLLAGKYHRYEALNPIHIFSLSKDISL